MGIVRIEALAALGALFELEIPELAGRVCIGVQPSSHVEELPNLSIEPTQWTYDPSLAEEVVALPGNRLVYNVGYHEAGCVISIMTATPGQRAAIEQKVISLFLASAHPVSGFLLPGVLVMTVTSCPELSSWTCSFDLDTDEWVDTLALDRRYESRIQVTATIPALIVDRGVYTIDQLILAVQALPDASLPASRASRPAVAPSELVTINIDGTIERFSPPQP